MIAFEVAPLLGKMTGIGYCALGQITALREAHPEHHYRYEFFSIPHGREKEQSLAPYLDENVSIKKGFGNAYVYRMASTLFPIPYHWFYGKEPKITHFFNYIVPPHVGGKSVATVHDMVYKAYPETVRGRTRHMLEMGLKQSLARADRVVTDSEFSKAEIIKYFPEHADKIRVVPCGVDFERFHPVEDDELCERVAQKYGIDSPYFLYLGTIEPRKNLERLIEAYSLFVAEHGSEVKLVLAGGRGWLCEGIFQKVQDLGISDLVLFTHYIDGADLCPLMSGALAFVFPSLYEGFGMPPLEAMACGTPVLTSDSASLPEVTGDCAVICKATSTESIAEGLATLYLDESLRDSLSYRGYERAKQFSWKHSANLLFDVYTELLPEWKG